MSRDNRSQPPPSGAVAAWEVMKRFASFLVVFALGTLGCHSDDHDHDVSGRPAACVEIYERCHPLDLGSGEIHECHESAEATWDEATCTAKKASCFAACTAPTDGGVDGASDASDAKPDAPGEAATDAASDATDAASDTPAG